MQAIIFDLDGTLCDSREAFFWQYAELTREFDGEPAPREAIAAAAHGTTETIVRSLVRNTEVPFEDILERHRQLRAQSAQLTRMYPGVDELLPILHRLGFRVAALTAGNQQNVEALRTLGIHQHFDVIVTADDVTYPKPDPEGLQLILAKLGVSPDQAAMVGDTPADIAVGKRGGVSKTIGVTHGFGTSEALQMAAPDHIVHDIPSLLDVLE